LADAGTPSRSDVTEWRRPSWPQVAVIVALLLVAFFVARPCQQSQVRVTKQQAIAIAERRADFEPELTQIRLLRQGVPGEPFWFVVLSVPSGADEDTFSKIAQFRVNANTGEVEEVESGDVQKPRKKDQR
jgi:hypothetical protein